MEDDLCVVVDSEDIVVVLFASFKFPTSFKMHRYEDYCLKKEDLK